MESVFSIKTSYKRIITALVFSGALLIYLNYLMENNDVLDEQSALVLSGIGLSLWFFIFNVKVTTPRSKLVYDLILLLVLSYMMAVCFDLLNGVIYEGTDQGANEQLIRFLLSTTFIFLIYFVFIALTGRFKLGCIIGTVVLAIGAIVTYMTLELRGSRLLFADIPAAGTALDVIESYEFPVEVTFLLGVIVFLSTIPILFQLIPIKYKLKSAGRLSFFLIFLYGFYGIFLTSFEEYDYSWNEIENSYVYSFFANAKLLTIHPSRNYTAEGVEEVINGANPNIRIYANENEIKQSIQNTFPDYVKETGSTDPNIIVIMNESLADLSIFTDDLKTSDLLPLTSTLSNTVKGDLFTEVRGGGTADSEYAFLTSNSTLLLPNSARPYQLYVNEDSPNIVNRLNTLGYETIAIHPGNYTAWNRNNVYQYFGFRDFFSASAFADKLYRRYPNLISDIATYNQIEALYENKLYNQEKNPLFIFDVTIQNHGGYNLGYENLDEVTGLSEDIPADVKEYISLVRASDKDFIDLVEYFKKAKEPTVICMFGDHQPNFTSNFFYDAIGKEEADYTIQESQRIQATPYIIWANYPLPNRNIGSISINYLSTLVTECAGLDRTPFELYLENLQTRLKIVNRKGIITDEGVYYTFDDPDLPEKYQAYIDDYKDVLYYSMLDLEDIDESIFTGSDEEKDE